MTPLIEEMQTVERTDSPFNDIRFSLLLIGISLLLALFKTQFVPEEAIGLGNIVFYIIALIPMIYLIAKAKITNRYTLFGLPFILIWCIDIFIYNNTLTQVFLPYILVGFMAILYLTSMHKVDYFYQTFIPRLFISFSFSTYISTFVTHVFSYNQNYSTYKRVLIGVLITLPFVGLFLALFRNADTNFNSAVTHFLNFFSMLELDHLMMIPVYFLIYVCLFLYSYLNRASRPVNGNKTSFDMLIISIFLGALNILFVTFLIFQIAYLFGGEDYIKESGISPAQFAREGFFQLAWVIALVVVIFLFIMRRYQGEKSIKVLMTFLMLQTLIMGIASLEKMHLYQWLLGATTLRYYVEWFEYFLLAVLVIGVVFTLFRLSFYQLLNIVMTLGLIAFSIVASLNIDYMVASNAIEKFKTEPSKLDKIMLSQLSLDALPVLMHVSIPVKGNVFEQSCHSLMQYHFGRCQRINQYNATQQTNSENQ